MRRLALVAATLVSAACGSRQKLPVPAPAPGPPPVTTTVPGTPRPGERVQGLDLDHDGRVDVWTFTVRGDDGRDRLVRREKDLDGDGRIDTWEELDQDGAPSRQDFDVDFDGRPDVTLFFQKGRLVRKEYHFGADRLPRTINSYQEGRMVRRERDTDGDGTIDAWETPPGGPATGVAPAPPP